MWSVQSVFSSSAILIACFLIPSWLPAATLAGSVVENHTGRPLARVRVTLTGGPKSPEAAGTKQLTGSGGGFQFDGLTAGLYYLKAEKKGYSQLRFGQRKPGQPGTPIVLQEDGYFSAALRLQKFGVITGAVLDENQVGIPDVSVTALRPEKKNRSAASAKTDDRGVYRLSGLEPGRYLVRTSAKNLEEGHSLLPTYFPEATSAAEAEVLHVELDTEIDSIDIAPPSGRLGRLSGQLTGASASEVVLLTGIGPRRVRVQPGGRFRFGEVEPGVYKILVEPSAAGGNLAAFQEVTVGSTAVETAVELKPAPVLSIGCFSDSGSPLGEVPVSVFLRRKTLGDTPVRATCGESAVWSPGNWEMAVSAPNDMYVTSILDAESREDAHEFFLGAAEELEIGILLSRRPARVSGKILTSGEFPSIGAPVFLNANDPELRSRIGGLKSTNTAADGEYRFSGLPPGTYEVFSSYEFSGETAEWPVGSGTMVTLVEGESKTLDLEILGRK